MAEHTLNENSSSNANDTAHVQNDEVETSKVDVMSPGKSITSKHPLQNRWVLWYDNPKKSKQASESWGDSMTTVYTFDTVEDFWGLFNNIIPVSDLPIGAHYHLFKEGIKPMWEDPRNESGGRWSLLATMKGRKIKVDDLWLHTVLGLIGETMDDEGDICGAVVGNKKGQMRISIWTGTASNGSLQKRIGHKMRESLELPQSLGLSFQPHESSKKRSMNHLRMTYEA